MNGATAVRTILPLFVAVLAVGCTAPLANVPLSEFITQIKLELSQLPLITGGDLANLISKDPKMNGRALKSVMTFYNCVRERQSPSVERDPIVAHFSEYAFTLSVTANRSGGTVNVTIAPSTIQLPFPGTGSENQVKFKGEFFRFSGMADWLYNHTLEGILKLLTANKEVLNQYPSLKEHVNAQIKGLDELGKDLPEIQGELEEIIDGVKYREQEKTFRCLAAKPG